MLPRTRLNLEMAMTDEMQEIADAGAKVLHNRCVQIGKKFDCNIIAKSTFSNEGGTRVCKKIEGTEVKSIVRNDKLLQINLEFEDKVEEIKVYQELLNANVIVESFNTNENFIKFIIKKSEETKVLELIERKFPECKLERKELVKLAIVGYGIIQDNTILNKIIKVLKKNKIEIENINLTQSKIEIIAKELEENVLEILHKELIRYDIKFKIR